MTKQPFLTDFPLVVFATAKRRLQAAIRRTSAIITRRSLSGYAVLFEDMLPGEFLASIDPTERQRKTLWMSVIAYNLIRSLMQKAAAEAGEPVWHISFKGVLDLVVSSHESLRVCAGKPNKRKAAVSQIVSICATKLISIRPFRREPRAVKRRPKPYQLLTEHRSKFIEIQHRGRYRKSA